MEVPWRVFAVETRTGRVVERNLPFISNPTWEYGLNIPGKWSVQLQVGGNGISKEDYAQISEGWRWCIGIARGNQILQCGPIVSASEPDDGKVTLTGNGLWHLFTKKRLLLPALFTGHDITAEDGSADLNLSGMTVGTIAKKLIEVPLARYGAEVPIEFPADVAGDRSKQYFGYELGMAGERLQDLVDEEDGPEVEFRPEFTSQAQNQVQWRMRIGTPNLGETAGFPHRWGYGRSMTEISRDRDFSKQTFAHFERGSGSEKDLVYGWAQDLRLIDAGFPLLEDKGSSHTGEKEKAPLDSWAKKYVDTYFVPTETWDVEIRSDGTDGQGRGTGSPSLDHLSAGDTGRVDIFTRADGSCGHKVIPDGAYSIRVLSVANGKDLEHAKPKLQPLVGVE